MSDSPDSSEPSGASGRPADPSGDAPPIEVELTDVLDLHSFRPSEVASVVRSYLDAAVDAGFTSIRLIHGRGTGTQRRTVRSVLERDARVVAFSDAPSDGGGWGATCAELRPGD